MSLRKPLRIKQNVLNQILEHVIQSYPNECCGVLIGKSYEDKFIEDSRRVKNVNQERSRDRYLMDANEFKAIDDWVRENKKQILGFYHSHPDHPNQPSEFDRQHAEAIFAHEIYSYLIIACEKGKKTAPRSWVLSEKTNQFEEESIEINSHCEEAIGRRSNLLWRLLRRLRRLAMTFEFGPSR